MSKRVVTIEGTGVVDVMDGVAKFLRKVSRGQVDDSYVGEITVVGIVDDCERRTLRMVFKKGDLITHDPQPASRADMASEGLPRLHAPIQQTYS